MNVPIVKRLRWELVRGTYALTSNAVLVGNIQDRQSNSYPTNLLKGDNTHKNDLIRWIVLPTPTATKVNHRDKHRAIQERTIAHDHNDFFGLLRKCKLWGSFTEVTKKLLINCQEAYLPQSIYKCTHLLEKTLLLQPHYPCSRPSSHFLFSSKLQELKECDKKELCNQAARKRTHLERRFGPRFYRPKFGRLKYLVTTLYNYICFLRYQL